VNTRTLKYLSEPELRFAFNQTAEDPRDGLTLFGPLDIARPYGVRAGVIGTEKGIELYRRWVRWAQRPVGRNPTDASRPVFPGFSAAFRTEWATDPVATIVLSDQEIDERLAVTDSHQRVFGVVSLYADRLLAARREDESRPDLWFVVVPDRLKIHCRPLSNAPANSVKQTNTSFRNAQSARQFKRNQSLFQELDKEADVYLHEIDFHNQLKARLLRDQVITQGVKERTLGNILALPNAEYSAGSIAIQPEIAWRLSTAVFYKCGGRPWKLAEVRPGVCYVGIVFKRDETHADPRWACCAAQMFLDSGDGMVFKGALGPWHSPDTLQNHLSYDAAKEIAANVASEYRRGGGLLKELYLHGRASFSGEEMKGFHDGAGSDVEVVGVTIKKDSTLKLFRAIGNTPLMRGSYYQADDRNAYLWTKGFVPRLRRYPGWEVPNGLKVSVRSDRVPIDRTMRDVLMLTKLNYNACGFADGVPVTLKFADAVGEILTAAPFGNQPPPPLPFRHYV
jgi:hypothetical protein